MAGTQTSTEKVDGGPPDTGGSSSTMMPQPIGVPYLVFDPNTGQWVPFGAVVDVKATGPGSAGTQGPGTAPSSGHTFVPPRYFDGAELAPATWDPARIADMQRRLIAAGLIPKTANIHIGVWDANSAAAFRDLLGFANSNGLEYLDALDKYASMPGTNPSGRAPLVTQPSNPDDLRTVFRKAIIDELGQGWDAERIDRMVSAYQADEVASQTAQYNAAETGGTVTPPPSPQAYAEAQVRSEDPLGAQEHDVIATNGPLDAFRSMLGGWSGG